MATLTEGMYEGEFIGEMAMGVGYHVDEETAADGETWIPGQVLGQLTADDTFVAYDAGVATGAETAAGISYAAVDASGGEVADARVVRRGPMTVNINDLEFGTAVQAEIDAAVAALLAIGIKAV